MKKQLIGFILPLLICVLTPLGAAAGFSMVMTYSPWPIAPGGGMGFTVQVKEDNEPVEGETITWSVSPGDGTASVNPTSSTTDSNGQVSTTLRVGSDASGSYTVTATRGSQSVSGTATVETSDDDDSSDDDSSDDDSSDDDSSDDDSSDDDSSDDDSSDDDSSDDDSSDDDSSDDDSSDDDSSDDDSSDDDSSDDDSSDDDSSDDDSSDDDSSDDGSSDDDSSDDDSSDDGSSDDDSSDDDSSDDGSSDDDSSDDGSSTGFPMVMTYSPRPIAPGESMTFTVEVQENGRPALGQTVTFSVSPDDGTASLSPTSSTTGSNGQVSTTLTLGSDASGSYTVTASVGSQSVSGTATVETSPPQDDQQQQRQEQSPEKTVQVSTGLHPQTLETSGGDQQGPAGAALDESFVVAVRDQNGDLFEGVQVAFAVTAGGGTLSATTATTDANGQAATTLTLGSDPGTNTVSATVKGLEPVTFSAVGYAIPHSLTKVSGDDQEGPAGAQLDEPFVVSALDEGGAAVVGAVVSFTVTAGGGTLSSTTATTGANGQAGSTLRLGSDPGTNTVEVTVAGLESGTLTFTAIGQETDYAGFDGFFQRSKLVGLPDGPQLAQNAPNPFNSQTVLSYFLLEPGLVRLEVFTLTGQRVAVLHQGPQQAGYHQLHWDGRDDVGRPLASGTYLYRLVTDETVLTRKLTLLR